MIDGQLTGGNRPVKLVMVSATRNANYANRSVKSLT